MTMTAGSQLASNLAKLPEYCYAFLACNPVGKRVIIIERGTKGYYPYDQADGDADTPFEIIKQAVDELNKRAGVTQAQKNAMIAGSMFGFHVPAADPDNEINKHDGTDEL